MNTTILEAMKQYRITAILRGIDREHLEPVVEALYAGGIRLLEITFNQGSATRLEDTAAAIARVKEIYGDRLHVGAGTVMSVEEVAAAHRAGAEFILAPNVDGMVIRAAVDRGLCAIPGAMTPTEIAGAYNAGAQIIKLFPAGNLGLGYCKAVMAPPEPYPHDRRGGRGPAQSALVFERGLSGRRHRLQPDGPEADSGRRLCRSESSGGRICGGSRHVRR